MIIYLIRISIVIGVMVASFVVHVRVFEFGDSFANEVAGGCVSREMMGLLILSDYYLYLYISKHWQLVYLTPRL